MARPGLEPGSLSIRESTELRSHMADFRSFPLLTALKDEVFFLSDLLYDAFVDTSVVMILLS